MGLQELFSMASSIASIANRSLSLMVSPSLQQRKQKRLCPSPQLRQKPANQNTNKQDSPKQGFNRAFVYVARVFHGVSFVLAESYALQS
jgi:hypothetical protein